MAQTAKERMYLTKDRKSLVPHGDKRAATLYAAPGDEIPDSAADKFGLKDGRLKGSAAKEAQMDGNSGKQAPAVKQGKQAGNKQAAAPANKEAGTGENK